MVNVAEARAAKAKAVADLMTVPGVTAVDVGHKVVGGERTDTIAVRVFVADKRDVSEKDAIPREIDGVPTDIIQMRFKPLTVERYKKVDVGAMVDATRYPALQGGMSIGPCRSIPMAPPDVPAPGNYVFVGTLGAIVTDNATGEPMMLTNFHVAAVTDTWSVGDTMAQPSLVDGGVCPADTVGTLARAVLQGTTATGPGVDGAVIAITDRESRCEILDVGRPTGTATAALGQRVRKRGRTTELTHGTVDSIDLTVRVPYGDGLGEVVLEDQIGIDVDASQSTVMGLGGDSGSVVVDDGNRVVGLYFAGNAEERDANGNVVIPEGVFGIANPIAAVETALGVRICVPRKPIKELKDKEHFKEFKEKEEFKEFKEKEEFKDKGEKEFKDKQEKEFREKDFKESKDKDFKDKREKELKEKDFKESKDFIEKEPETRWHEAAGRPERPPQRRGKTCLDLTTVPVGAVGNPWQMGSATFSIFDHAGNPWPHPRIVTWGGFTGLDLGFLTIIDLPVPAASVTLDVVHFSQPARAVGYTSGGVPAASASMSGPQAVGESLQLLTLHDRRLEITQVQISAPQDETLLLRLCWGVVKMPKNEFEKPFREIDKYREIFGGPMPYGAADPSGMEARLARVEEQLTHFISKDLRPDIGAGVTDEDDVGDLSTELREQRRRTKDARGGGDKPIDH